MAQDPRIPSFLHGKKFLQRAYLEDLRRASSRGGCARNCEKADIDRKYAKLANPQAGLEKKRKNR